MKLLKFLMLFAVIFAVGCRGCDLDDLSEQVGNGNANPELLTIELTGGGIASALAIEYGASCNTGSNFNAEVEILIRTASIVDGFLVLDKDPYDEFDRDIVFSNNKPNEFTLQVPETGAYGIFIEVEFDDCDLCCHGGIEGQCGASTEFQNGVFLCEAGKPQVAIEQTFLSETRPEFHLNWNPSDFNLINVRDCRACGCFVNCQ